MVMEFRRPRHGRRITVCVLLLAVAGIGQARAAGDTNCTTTYDASRPPLPTDCPGFAAQYQAIIDRPFVGMPTPIAHRYNQADLESNAFDLTYYFPKEWGFAVQAVRPGEHSAGGPATSCADMFDLRGNPGSGPPHAIARGEVLSESAGIRFLVGPNGARSAGRYGFQVKNSNVDEFATNPLFQSLSFMRWRAADETADLCLYLFLATNTQPPAPAGLTELFLDVSLQRLSDDPKFGWSAHVDLRGLLGSQWAYDNALSIVQNLFHISDNTTGNWNLDPYGRPKKVAFSFAPSEPETGYMGVDYKICRRGRNNPSLNTTFCINGDILTIRQDQLINITPAWAPGLYYFGRITGVGTNIPSTFQPQQTGSLQPSGFSLVAGVDTASVSWVPPLGTTPVKGYILAIAKPNVQDSLHLFYLVTQRYLLDQNGRVRTDAEGNPLPNPGFDPSMPCGPEGENEICRFAIKFPMTGVGGTILDGNGKHDVALITVYPNGYRTDGLCDNGRPEGAVCDPNLPRPRIFAPGVSAWEFYGSQETWPLRYVSSSQGTPRFVLLVNYPLKRAQLFRWGANTVPTTTFCAQACVSTPLVGQFSSCPGCAKDTQGQVYEGSATTIRGSGGSGIVSFGNFKPDGGAASFRFDGFTVERVQAPIPFLGAPAPAAFGVFHLYEPKNFLPGVVNPLNPGNPLPRGECVGAALLTGCGPTDYIDLFQGQAL